MDDVRRALRILSITVTVAACGAEPAGSSNPQPGGGKTGQGGAVEGDGGALTGDAPAGSAFPDLRGTDAVQNPTCASKSVQAELLPLDLYFMLDSSASMNQLTATGASKWTAVKTALTSFVSDPQSAGIGVGLQYFPQVRPGVPPACAVDAACGGFGPCDRLRTCDGGSKVVFCQQKSDCPTGQNCVLLGQCAKSDLYCIGTLCPPLAGQAANSNPCVELAGNCRARDLCETAPYGLPAVPIGPLPGQAGAFTTSLAAHQPDGLTPTGPALGGAIAQAKARAVANPGHRVAVVLATDGFPSECGPSDIPGIGALASAAAPAIPTFVIGVFAPEQAAEAAANLNALAVAGGTGRAFVIDTQQNVAQAFSSALTTIRSNAIACDYKIPSATGGAVDFNRVNVQFTAGAGQTTTVRYVSGKANCDPKAGGWYYDADPATGGQPTTISVCEASCAGFRTDARGKLDILLGCQTNAIP